ncbi:MAG: ABC transporter ATP-binding protein [Clostridia bacterium]|nr:ABC transporter ATP-binding protein [Clostridia bacterium]
MAVLQDKGSSRVELHNVSRFFGDVKAVNEVSFSIEEGEFFSLLGPSGCGKTTTLRLIAGLDRPDAGTITIGQEGVAGEKVWVGPEKRGIGIVFQDYALFPHMTVEQNIAFGLDGLNKEEARQRTEEMLTVVGLVGLGKRYPHEISGGQCQRVALARSLAPLPKVILLDEPFSNLDADLREELRNETRRILKERGTTTILVTHDQEEAFSLSDRVGVLNLGRLEQIGTPAEIYHHPSTRFVADFVGKADFVAGSVEGGVVVSDIGSFPLNGEKINDSNAVEIMIRPDDVDFVEDGGGNATIVEARFLGASIMYIMQLSNGKVLHSLKPSTKAIPTGAKVQIKVDAAHIVLFPKAVG